MYKANILFHQDKNNYQRHYYYEQKLVKGHSENSNTEAAETGQDRGLYLLLQPKLYLLFAQASFVQDRPEEC